MKLGAHFPYILFSGSHTIVKAERVFWYLCTLIARLHLVLVHAKVASAEAAVYFMDSVFHNHGLPMKFVSYSDPPFKPAFWTSLFELLEEKLKMSTAAHPETDGQIGRVNRVLEDVLRSYATSFASWSAFLPLAEFALNNAVHALTGLTPFFVNSARHSRVPTLLAVGRPTVFRGSTVGEDEIYKNN